MQRGDQSQCIDMQCTTQPGLSSLKGWWWDWCLFFDDWKHHKLISLTRERASPRVSLLYSAKSAPLKGFSAVRKRSLQVIYDRFMSVLDTRDGPRRLEKCRPM